MARRQRRLTVSYAVVLAVAFLLAVAAGWTSLASRMDRDAYDWMTRSHVTRAGNAQSIVLAFDEQTLSASGGMRRIRTSLAAVLARLQAAKPAVVAIDIILADEVDPAEDQALADALRKTSNLILPSDSLPGTASWEDPAPLFRRAARALGHIHAAPDPVSRVLPLELTAGRDRRWAMALEAARLKLDTSIIESPQDLDVGGIRIPAGRDSARAMYIRYREGIPVLSVARLQADPALFEQLRDKAVFIGVTAQSAARDRLMTPLDFTMSGVEIHAQAFETIMGRDFLQPASLSMLVMICLSFAAASGLVFALLSGWTAYLAGTAIILLAHGLPHIVFAQGLVLPYLPTIFAAWLTAISAASWQHFVVRKQLERSESDRQRYQQAIQFVTHEMRSPLTAIQGSSELMGRYNLTDDKRRQMAQMINSESKRLAKMIQTFLDMERLSDGQADIRSEPFELTEVLDSCIERAGVLAERKQIKLHVEPVVPVTLRGDRELMEYAIYNLLTNAIKYSEEDTHVTVSVHRDGALARIMIRDQGMGMDNRELRNIFRRFYRTKKAEASGEAGTGIGLSLVQQIVVHHQGRMEVTSTPGAGSCFTMVLPV